MILAESELSQPRSPRPHQRAQISCEILKVPYRAEACAVQDLFSDLANARDGADRQRTKKPNLIPFWNKRKAIGLLKVAGQFGQQLVGGNSYAGRKAAFFRNSFPELPRNGYRSKQRIVHAGQLARRAFRGNHAGKIKIGFIDGHLLDEGAARCHDAHDLPRLFAVVVHPGSYENSCRAESPRYHTGHGRPNTKSPRFITGSADHSALRGWTAYDYRFASERWFIPLLYRRVKCIHVQMENDTKHAGET